jgi:hypothetical protein
MVTVTATPADGWVFTGWVGDVTSPANPLSFPITVDTTLTATFEKMLTAPSITTGSIGFTKQVIHDGAKETHAAVAADFNGNGHLDVVATDFVDGVVYWYENDGSGGFVTRVLDPALAGAYPVEVADVDGDGHVDVLAGGYLGGTFAWYQNDGTGSFTRHVIDARARGPHSIVGADLNGDGHLDLLTTNQDAGTVTWYENDGAQNFTFRMIDADARGAKRAEVGDVNGNGILDVVVASFFDDTIAWHESDGAGNFTKHVIDRSARGAYYAVTADVDDDGNLDILAASQLDNTIAWYRNDGAGGFSKHVIDPSAGGARTVITADITGNGHVDVIAATVNDDAISWYENDGTGSFTTHAVDVTAQGAYGVFAIDFDGDGTIDIVSASRDSNEIAIHFQARSHTALVPPSGVVALGPTHLSTTHPDTGPEGLVYTIEAPPERGTLLVGAVAVPAGGTFTQDDIDRSLVTYEHAGADMVTDRFTFTVSNGAPGTPVSRGSFDIVVIDPTPAVAHLRFDEGSGSIATDASGNGNDGTLLGGASFDAETADGSPSSVRLDGADDLVLMPAFDVEGTGLTLTTWFKAESFTTTDARLISKVSGTAANDHVFMLSTFERSPSNVVLRARVRIGGSTRTLIAPTGSLSAGRWHHAAVTHDGQVLRLYLDGQEVGSTVAGGRLDVDPTIPVAVGAQPLGAGGGRFHGLVDDVRVLRRALAPEEIAALWAGTP